MEPVVELRRKHILAHSSLLLAEDAKLIRWPWIVCAAWSLMYFQCWLDAPLIAAMVTGITIAAVFL